MVLYTKLARLPPVYVFAPAFTFTLLPTVIFFAGAGVGSRCCSCSYLGASGCGDVCLKACSLQLGRLRVCVCFHAVSSDLHSIKVPGLLYDRVETFRLYLLVLGVCVGLH